MVNKKKINFKAGRKVAGLLVLTLLFCGGCGNSKSGEKSSKNNKTELYENTQAAYSTENYYEGEEIADIDNNISYAGDEEIGITEKGLNENNENESENIGEVYGNNGGNIDRQMLVYRGQLSIDTMDFATSVNDFKTMVKQKGGFIESETYSDNGLKGGYYAVDKSETHNEYVATVRIPSNEYESVMDSSTSLGDVRDRNSRVTNVTQEYGTYKTRLEIYEAEYARYLALLEKAEDESYALQIENELFDIQMQIAELKSGITNIENDVAYSYIDITIHEVSEYEEEPEPEDTFGQRFKNTCKSSWENFLEALENLLFEIIMNIYAIILILIIIVAAIVIVRKKSGKNAKKRKANHGEEKYSDEN